MIILDGVSYNANVGKIKIITDFSVEEYSDTSGETISGKYIADLKGTMLTLNIPLKTERMNADERKAFFEALAENTVHKMVIPINGEIPTEEGRYIAQDVYILAGRRTDIMHWDATHQEYVFDYSTISDITVRLQNYWRK